MSTTDSKSSPNGASNGGALATTNTSAPAAASGYAVVPTSFSELKSFCQLIAGSDLAPTDYKGKPGNVLVAVQMGAEIGLKPMQALQNIAVINGRPSVWGDAALGLIKQHPLFVSCEEWIEGANDDRTAWCRMIRKGEPPVLRSFSVADAKRANLWKKKGPWEAYPDRMQQMRARGFCGRDAFPDALKGLSFAEEAMDIPYAEVASAQQAPQTRAEMVRAQLGQQAAAVETAPAAGSEEKAAPEAQTRPIEEKPAADEGAVDEKQLARDLRNAIARAWSHVVPEARAAALTREYAKGTLIDLNVRQLQDFLERTPDLLPEPAPDAAQ